MFVRLVYDGSYLKRFRMLKTGMLLCFARIGVNPPQSPFFKGGDINVPLFGKEGLGEI